MRTGVSIAGVARTAQLGMEQVVRGGPVLIFHLAVVRGGRPARDRRDVGGLGLGGGGLGLAHSGGAGGARGDKGRQGGTTHGGRGREARQRAEGQGATVAHLRGVGARRGAGQVEAGIRAPEAGSGGEGLCFAAWVDEVAWEVYFAQH